MTAFLTWLASTRAGQTTMAIGAALMAFFYALFRAREAGKTSEKSKQDKATIRAHQDRERIDDEVKKLDDAATRRELGAWRVRDTDNS